jgi:capsular polysaccharide biosynthesis protein
MAIIFLELIDDRFTTAHQIEQRLGIPILAAFGERTW